MPAKDYMSRMDTLVEAVVASFLHDLNSCEPDSPFGRDYIEVLHVDWMGQFNTTTALLWCDLVGDHTGCQILGVFEDQRLVFGAFSVDDWAPFEVRRGN